MYTRSWPFYKFYCRRIRALLRRRLGKESQPACNSNCSRAIKTMYALLLVSKKRIGSNPRTYAFSFPWLSRPSQLITFMEHLGGHIFAPTHVSTSRPRVALFCEIRPRLGLCGSERVWLRDACKPSEITQRRRDQKAAADLQPIFHACRHRKPLMTDIFAIGIVCSFLSYHQYRQKFPILYQNNSRFTKKI